MSLLGLLVVLIVGCLLFWCVRQLLAAFGIGEPIATLVQVVFVVILVIWLLQSIGVVTAPALHLR